MSRSDKSRPTEHPTGLFLEYVEDRLPQEDRTMIEHHIRECGECSAELRGLDRMLNRLRISKEAFCPDTEELYELVVKGKDPHGKVGRHIQDCPLCAEEAASYREICAETALPEKVRTAIDCRFGKSPVAVVRAETQGLFERLSEWVGSPFRVPALAAGALAAAVLFAVLIYPRSGLEPTVGLSPVAWEPPGGSVRFKGDLFGAKKPGVAVLLLFKGFKKPVPQERVDTLYEALKPTPNLFEQYDFLTPAEVREAVRESKVKPKSAQAILERVARDFHLSRGLVVTISPERDKFLIEAEVMQLPTRTVLKQETWDGVAADQLAARLRDMVSMVDARE